MHFHHCLHEDPMIWVNITKHIMTIELIIIIIGVIIIIMDLIMKKKLKVKIIRDLNSYK